MKAPRTQRERNRLKRPDADYRAPSLNVGGCREELHGKEVGEGMRERWH